jgi:hypothetical protein
MFAAGHGESREWRRFMITPRRTAALTWACLVLAAAMASAQVDPALMYGPRGDRSEGLRTIAVSGYDIELLSARVGVADPFDAPPRPTGWASNVRLSFYLPDDDKVFINVRQLRARSTYYWLDNVTTAFRARTVNPYAWSTEPVLKRLPDVRLDDLGVTVRLGQKEAARRERVLPAVFDGSVEAAARKAYLFHLKTNGRASVTATIYAGDTKVFQRPATVEAANSPFVVTWDAGASPEGWYRLMLTGFFTATNAELDKEILFYHRPGLLTAAPPR